MPSTIEAILFDMDDTLVDSERAWIAAADRLWAEAGSRNRAPVIPGGTVDDLVDAHLAEFADADQAAATGRLRALLDEELGRLMRPMPGAVDLLERLDPALPIAVASNSPSAVVQRTVAALGWSDRLSAALGAEDVAQPKPAPDIYLEAARRCGAAIDRCVVVEDSPMGARAALDAGAFLITIGLPSTGHVNVSSLCDELITSWNPRTPRER
ncbi:HAD family hydrolase [Actinomyces respiraculi]|uniref:HAD family hydrolase n=1 Tax=Actinomyces respiraculi TaxID=2744574 RepID=UPI0014228B35|nr:HAD family phosphatase [Actinomyces respiraculi]